MKFRQSIFLLIALAMIAALVACSSSSKSTPPPPVVAIAATSGGGQNAVVSTAFTAPLVATVTTGGTPTGGVSVIFTAPSSGASGTFANRTATETDTTNASGVATSSTFTANATAGGYTVTAAAAGASTPASFSLTNTAAPVETVAATSGTPQTATVSTAFGGSLVATVTKGGTPVSGATVTFTAPGSGASGTFGNGTATESDTTNASGVATSSTFTANATIGAYTVTATVTGVSGAANFSLTNVVATTLANGTYVFTLSGEDQFANTGSTCVTAANTACGPYFVAGAFVVSSGTITGGEQDFVDLGIKVTDPITGGAVTTTADGNLQITLTTADTSIGVSGVETLSGTLVSTSTGVITEFDASATSSGVLAEQTPTLTAPSSGYAFFTAGVDGSNLPVAIGGVLNISSGNVAVGTSVFDINDDGTIAQAQTFASGTVSGPDASGRVTFALVPSAASIPPISLVGYIVGPKHIWLVETGDTFGGTMGGQALGQGVNTGTFNPASFTSFVFNTSGVDNLTGTVGAFQVAGVLTATSGSTVSGTLNFNDLTGTGVQSPIPVTGNYTVDATGRVTLSSISGGSISNAAIQIYLSGNGDGTVISMDTGDVLAGLANQQTGGGSFTAASFAGLYGMNATGFDFNNELEFDADGLVSADGVSALSGTVDLNFMTPPGTQTPGVSISGVFTANASGVFTGTIAGLDIDTPANNDAFTFYMIDTTRAVAIETDANQLTLIKFALQQ
jgi:hypothetical protein